VNKLLQRFDFRSSSYERPTQNWVCGHAAKGTPCRIGPDGRGRCRATYECNPRQEDHRWICTRPNGAGGKCAQGPLPDGTCCRPIPKCVPVRSLRGKRGRTAMWVVILTVGFLTLAQGGSQMVAAVSPGPISAAHGSVGNCQTCHAAADGGLAHWMMAAFAGGPADESKRCLSCHTLGDAAGQPHGVAAETAAAWTRDVTAQPGAAAAAPFGQAAARSLFGAPQDASESLACATCHKEHQGAAFESMRMSDGRCQACHAVQFASFADGHPEFDGYPFRRRTRIDFNHVSHFQRHFPKVGPEKSPQTCMDCHQPAADGGLMLVEGFAKTCSACHADQIRGAGQIGPAGIAFITVPGLDLAELRARGAQIGEWPDDWSEARVTPFMRALLAGDKGVQDDMRRLDSLDLLDLTDSSDEDIAAIERVVWRIKGLIYRLLEGGAADVKTPLSQALGEDLSREDLARILAVIPADVIRSAQAVWFPDLADEMARRARGESVPIPGAGSAAADQGAAQAPAQPEPEASGGADVLSGLAQGADSGDEDILSGLAQGAASGEGDILSGGQDDQASGGGDILSGGQEDILSGGQDDQASGGGDILSGGQDDILSGAPDNASGGDILSGGELDNLVGGESGAGTETAAPAADAKKASLPEVDPEKWAVLGGWYRRDFTLYYKPVGHGDAFVKTWLDLSAAGYAAADRAAGRAVFDTLSNPEAPGRCAKCHSVDRVDGGAMQVNWVAKHPQPNVKAITRFSHSSHFSLLDDRGCMTCHKIDAGATYDKSYGDRDPFTFWSNFGAIKQETCAACHAAGKVADTCTTCHRYHVGTFATRAVPTAMK